MIRRRTYIFQCSYLHWTKPPKSSAMKPTPKICVVQKHHLSAGQTDTSAVRRDDSRSFQRTSEFHAQLAVRPALSFIRLFHSLTTYIPRILSNHQCPVRLCFYIHFIFLFLLVFYYCLTPSPALAGITYISDQYTYNV